MTQTETGFRQHTTEETDLTGAAARTATEITLSPAKNEAFFGDARFIPFAPSKEFSQVEIDALLFLCRQAAPLTVTQRLSFEDSTINRKKAEILGNAPDTILSNIWNKLHR